MINKSRYIEDLEVTDENNEKLYERRDIEELEIGDEVVKYSIKEDDKLTDISYKLYGDARYWWIIADVVNVYNPFEKLKLRQQIVILPTLKTIHTRILI